MQTTYYEFLHINRVTRRGQLYYLADQMIRILVHYNPIFLDPAKRLSTESSTYSSFAISDFYLPCLLNTRSGTRTQTCMGMYSPHADYVAQILQLGDKAQSISF